jgi:hypothetical protein
MVYFSVSAPHLSIERARGEREIGGIRRLGGTATADDGVWGIGRGWRGTDDVEEEEAG